MSHTPDELLALLTACPVMFDPLHDHSDPRKPSRKVAFVPSDLHAAVLDYLHSVQKSAPAPRPVMRKRPANMSGAHLFNNLPKPRDLGSPARPTAP